MYFNSLVKVTMEARLTGLLILFVVQVETEACTTPSGHTGTCIPMGKCPGLIDIFANYVKGTEELLDKYLCKNRYVCCPDHWNSDIYHRKLADKSFCGLQRTDERLHQTPADISIDEFPWLAALISKDKLNNKEEILCQGSLINNRYVITAADCTSNRRSPVTIIRLGEFNIKNGTDCVEVEKYHDEDCSTTVEYGIEEIIPHHFYSSRTGQNDVALIRLNKDVKYTDYIRPICIPTPDMTPIRPGDTLYATGWGKTSTEEKSEVKKKIRTTLIENSECQNILNEFKTTIVLTSYNTCTLDEDDSKDFSCSGDSGGPVMFSYKHRWYLESIISTGIGCGRKIPDVQAKVFPYLNWIKQHTRL